MPVFERDGVAFRYRDEGSGAPLFFQHGLGGDVAQPFGVLAPAAGFRMIAFDFRGHGETRPLGDEEKLSFDAFGDDLVALMDHLKLPAAILGGISMGAGVSLNVALRRPERVQGLVLSRPAWLDAPSPPNLAILEVVARLIRQHGSRGGLALFRQSREYARVLEESPDAARSLLAQFEGPRAEDGVARLERLPDDAPSRDRAAWRRIAVPTLVLGHRQDPVHPWGVAEELAGLIPGAELSEVTAKSVSRGRHAADVQREVEAYLARHFS